MYKVVRVRAFEQLICEKSVACLLIAAMYEPSLQILCSWCHLFVIGKNGSVDKARRTGQYKRKPETGLHVDPEALQNHLGVMIFRDANALA